MTGLAVLTIQTAIVVDRDLTIENAALTIGWVGLDVT